jgi:CheY-like chemotaxis protein
VESEVGKGTTFRVVLPAARSTEVVEQPPVQMASAATRRARILIVDDDPMLSSVMRRALSNEHDVVAINAASEALDRLRAGERFDLILCDLMMPQMTGMDLYAALRNVDPASADRMIFMTGGAFTPVARAFLDEVPNQRMEKPFDVQHLRSIVNDRIK